MKNKYKHFQLIGSICSVLLLLLIGIYLYIFLIGSFTHVPKAKKIIGTICTNPINVEKIRTIIYKDMVSSEEFINEIESPEFCNYNWENTEYKSTGILSDENTVYTKVTFTQNSKTYHIGLILVNNHSRPWDWKLGGFLNNTKIKDPHDIGAIFWEKNGL